MGYIVFEYHKFSWLKKNETKVLKNYEFKQSMTKIHGKRRIRHYKYLITIMS